jgi:hypothetical protein
LKPKREQLAAWKRALRVTGRCDREEVGSSSPDLRGGLLGVAAGRVEGELGAVDVDPYVPDLERDAGEDVGDRVRGGAVDFRCAGEGVKAQGLSDDHGADVEGAGDGGDDADHRERRLAYRTREVEVAGDVGELGADPRSSPDAADARGGRAGGVGAL